MPNFLEDVAKDILVDVATKALEEPAKEIGKELADLLNVLFTPIQAAKLYRDAWLKDFGDRILKKFEKIPEERRISPPLEIVGPAIEASRYFIQKEDMREKFANLIAHACDKQMIDSIHPAFPSFLQQMTSLEAEIIQLFRVKQEAKMGINFSRVIPEAKYEFVMQGLGIHHYPERFLPIVSYHLINKDSQRTIYRHIINLPCIQNPDTLSSSISNLSRMGLIDMSYTQRFEEENYNWALENQIYQELIQYTKSGHTNERISLRALRGTLLVEGTYDRLVIEKGIVHLTQLGYDFIKCCVLDQEVIIENT